jgi:hypothetical protein
MIEKVIALALSSSILLGATDERYFRDSYLICGPEPLTQCLDLAQECLIESYEMGFDSDESFEYCASKIEEIDPYLIKWVPN